MKQQWRLIVSLLIVILVVVFALKNTQSVLLDFVFTRVQIPLVLVILVCLLLGVIAGLVTSLSTIGTSRKRVKSLENQLETTISENQSKEQSLTELRQQLAQFEPVKSEETTTHNKL